jgi:hypothetical protein
VKKVEKEIALLTNNEYADLFNEEMDLLNNEIQRVEEFFNETIDHFNLVKKATNTRGNPLSFIHQQTENINSLFNTKISLIKEKIAVKEKIANLNLKKKDDNGNNQVLAEFMKLLPDLKISTNHILTTDMGTDEELDKKIKEYEESGELSFSDYEKNTKIVTDLKGNLYLVDDQYNLIDENPDSDIIINFVKQRDGTMIAYDQYNNEVEIVSNEE